MFDLEALWKEHKEGIILAGGVVIGVAVGVGVVLRINGKEVKIPAGETAGKFLSDTTKAAKPIMQETAAIEANGASVIKTFSRSECVRKLHKGWKASPRKLAQAAAMGLELKPGETIVNACTVTKRVA